MTPTDRNEGYAHGGRAGHGGAGGIGAAICAELVAQGHAVAVADRDTARAEEVAATLDGKSLGIGMDVADDASVAAAVARVDADLGPVTGLVNNAGIDVIGRFVDSTPQTWDRLIAVNLRGTIGVTRAVLDGMIARAPARSCASPPMPAAWARRARSSTRPPRAA